MFAASEPWRGSAPAPLPAREQGNKLFSSQEQPHHPPGRPWSRFTRSAHPNSLWKELPRHWETSSCVRPNKSLGLTKPGCSTLLPSRCIAVWTPRRITPPWHPPCAASFLSVGFAVLTALFREGGSGAGAGEEDPGPLNRLACGSHGSGPAVPFSCCPHSQELFAELRAPVQNCFSKEPLSA